MFSRYAAVLFPFILGCNVVNHPSDHYTVYIDPAFGYDGQAVIVDALNDWEHAVNSHDLTLRFNIVSLDLTCSNGQEGCDKAITIHPDTKSDLQSMAKGDDEVAGYTIYRWSVHLDGSETEYANVYLRTDISAVNHARNTRHEIGHGLFESHTGKGTVMYISTDGEPDNVSCEDVQQYASLRNEWINCPGGK